MRIIFDRSSVFTDQIHRSRWAFRFGLRGGKLSALLRTALRIPSNADRRFVSRSCDKNLQHTEKPSVRQGHVSGHLFHPCVVRGGGPASDANLPRADTHESQNVVGDHPGGRPNNGLKEIHRSQDLGVGSDKFPPRRLPLPFGSRKEAVALQNIANNLMTDFVAQVVERTKNPPIAPSSIFLSHSNDQFPNQSICAGPASGRAAP